MLYKKTEFKLEDDEEDDPCLRIPAGRQPVTVGHASTRNLCVLLTRRPTPLFFIIACQLSGLPSEEVAW
jgi:hypothetical protein